MITKNNITGIILAGGKSSRMGRDKAQLTLNNSTFLESIISVLKPYVNELIIISDNKEHDKFKIRREEDIIKNSGPLSGLHTGLHHAKHEYVLALSCDIPLISEDIIKSLIANSKEHTDVNQIKSNSKTMPLIAMYKKSCLIPFYNFLINDERRVRVAVESLITNTIEVDHKYSSQVKNINTQEDFKSLNMQIKIKYFGLLVEATGCTEEVFTSSSVSTINDLIEELILKYPKLKTKDFQVAQNNTIVNKKESINQTEIALLPPFAGG